MGVSARCAADVDGQSFDSLAMASAASDYVRKAVRGNIGAAVRAESCKVRRRPGTVWLQQAGIADEFP